jgi:hypothetical protein
LRFVTALAPRRIYFGTSKMDFFAKPWLNNVRQLVDEPITDTK